VTSGALVSFQIGGRVDVETPTGGTEWGLRFAITLLFPKDMEKK